MNFITIWQKYKAQVLDEMKIKKIRAVKKSSTILNINTTGMKFKLQQLF